MKLFAVLILVISFLEAKKDFFYNFIDSSGNQISEKSKLQISDGFEVINQARKLAKEGRIDEAYSQIEAFKAQNKIRILESDIYILYAELCLKKKSKRLIIQAAKELEAAINNSRIHEDELAHAYMILIELKLNLNRAEDAVYFSNIIINNFDNPVTKAYGKIYLSKVYKFQKDYSKAINILYKILTETTDVLVATIVADELFDVYILDDKKDEANKLISKVLQRNIDYYADDSYLALEKVDKLVKVGMPGFAAEILEELLKRTTSKNSIEDFKFKLADTYMNMYDRTPKYLIKARELFKDVINDYPEGIYFEKSKMYLDEILMREGKIEPAILVTKYPSSESMEQKVLLQELLNDWKRKNFEIIIKSERVYKKISDSIAKRFGFDSIGTIFDEINIDMIKTYLKDGKCSLLGDILDGTRSETFELLVKDEEVKDSFFECTIESPSEKIYGKLVTAFNDKRDANIYLYLERMAIALKKYSDAKNLSAKVEMVDDKSVLSKEFLYRFLILYEQSDIVAFDRFFDYARKNPNYIEDNKENPIIIDFYYSYYLYLLRKDLKVEAKEILDRLYNKQQELNAHIYSPFVELELAKNEQSNNNYDKALELLLNSLDYTRKIKPNDLAQTYYEIIKLYDSFGNKIKKDEYITKCKEIKDAKDSLYKKMCDEM
ncbi:tetratricopeptide repeat protein [Halarcobacter ebronensis]|uniref:Uncharacterized protein n=1 Tax=Halarcobacter ebronensis TaxID=1462615 RepID=A0A4Q1AMI6_9BACT|nr:hypothetical protein [Halarcobacter ebronensis]QKF82889.1 hypothetical protein AEBR_2422 [Halarcobacter ebronensis]RXK06906.1 hypothetical protein CRV07_05620 [Halarcobacter ebronensis]